MSKQTKIDNKLKSQETNYLFQFGSMLWKIGVTWYTRWSSWSKTKFLRAFESSSKTIWELTKSILDDDIWWKLSSIQPFDHSWTYKPFFGGQCWGHCRWGKFSRSIFLLGFRPLNEFIVHEIGQGILWCRVDFIVGPAQKFNQEKHIRTSVMIVPIKLAKQTSV